MIVDYIWCAQDNPTSVLPTFNHENFQGKGIGKLLINLIQTISIKFSNGVENVVMLKCTDKLNPFFKSVGLEALSKSSKWEEHKDVINHYDEIKVTIPLGT